MGAWRHDRVEKHLAKFPPGSVGIIVRTPMGRGPRIPEKGWTFRIDAIDHLKGRAQELVIPMINVLEAINAPKIVYVGGHPEGGDEDLALWLEPFLSIPDLGIAFDASRRWRADSTRFRLATWLHHGRRRWIGVEGQPQWVDDRHWHTFPVIANSRTVLDREQQDPEGHKWLPRSKWHDQSIAWCWDVGNPAERAERAIELLRMGFNVAAGVRGMNDNVVEKLRDSIAALE